MSRSEVSRDKEREKPPSYSASSLKSSLNATVAAVQTLGISLGQSSTVVITTIISPAIYEETMKEMK